MADGEVLTAALVAALQSPPEQAQSRQRNKEVERISWALDAGEPSKLQIAVRVGRTVVAHVKLHPYRLYKAFNRLIDAELKRVPAPYMVSPPPDFVSADAVADIVVRLRDENAFGCWLLQLLWNEAVADLMRPDSRGVLRDLVRDERLGLAALGLPAVQNDLAFGLRTREEVTDFVRALERQLRTRPVYTRKRQGRPRVSVNPQTLAEARMFVRELRPEIADAKRKHSMSGRRESLHNVLRRFLPDEPIERVAAWAAQWEALRPLDIARRVASAKFGIAERRLISDRNV